MNNFFNYFFEIYPLFYLLKKTIYKTEDFQNWLTIDHSEKYITHELFKQAYLCTYTSIYT